jgi:hypothetical protein
VIVYLDVLIKMDTQTDSVCLMPKRSKPSILFYEYILYIIIVSQLLQLLYNYATVSP